MILAVLIANILGWPILQLGIAYAFTRMPGRYFTRHLALYRELHGEKKFYRDILQVRRWKSHLPDGSSWVGGKVSRRNLSSRNPAYFQRFLIETRRSELAHWVMLSCAPVFFLWNPPWACSVMLAYAIAANIPCIVVQRYNRFTIQRLLAGSANPTSIRGS